MIEARRSVRAPRPKDLKDESRLSGAPSSQLIVEWLVPERYARASSTPLTAEVVRGNNTIDFNLTAEPVKALP